MLIATTSYTHDALNQLKTERDPLADTWTYSFWLGWGDGVTTSYMEFMTQRTV